ncbi:MAG: STAS-like domain-containing protein [Betaproteobacteria bacterium]
METICRLPLPFGEDQVWIDVIQPWLAQRGIDGEAMNIAGYVVSEMLNNVRDHSASADVVVEGMVGAQAVFVHVIDHGVGVFRRLADGLRLTGPREAVIEIAKGKRTTDPSQHTGQGIFFASRVCEWFCIEANGYAVTFEEGQEPIHLEFVNDAGRVGTTVKCRIAQQPRRSLRQVFDEYCPQPDIEFTRTRVAVRLMALADGSLISRSQARRLMAGLERFTEVELDFAGVAELGQGFADEAFRVWRNTHPGTDLRVLNAAEGVERMLRHVGFRRTTQ